MFLKFMKFKLNHKLNYGETSFQNFTRRSAKHAERCSLNKFIYFVKQIKGAPEFAPYPDSPP